MEELKQKIFDTLSDRFDGYVYPIGDGTYEDVIRDRQIEELVEKLLIIIKEQTEKVIS